MSRVWLITGGFARALGRAVCGGAGTSAPPNGRRQLVPVVAPGVSRRSPWLTDDGPRVSSHSPGFEGGRGGSGWVGGKP